ncbi:MAG: cell division protein SepF [bacterium]
MQDYQEKEGFFSKIVRIFSGFKEDEEDGYEDEPELEELPVPKRRWSLFVHSRKDIPIYKKDLTKFEMEAEEAALRLRQGFIVIVNLEKASDEAARRIIDFLSGVSFGIKGSREKLGGKVFIFAPPGYAIYSNQ